MSRHRLPGGRRRRLHFCGPAFLRCLLFLLLLPLFSLAQQPYINNKQDDCYGTNSSSVLGYSCAAAGGGPRSCSSFLMFRSQTNYQSPLAIGYLLNANVSAVASINGVADVDPIPANTLVIVPVDCSCSGRYYQHDASYVLKYTGETYFLAANDTYQGLSTCQALMAQNPFRDSYNLTGGMNITVPLRCACPSAGQSAAGVKYLLSYLVTWGDSIADIARRFGVPSQSVFAANNLTAGNNIYPFTTVLVPLPTEPTKAVTASPAPPPPASTDSPPGGGSSKKWIFIGLGAGAFLLAISCVTWFVFCRRRLRRPSPPAPEEEGKIKTKDFEISDTVKQGFPPISTTVSSSLSGKIRNVLDSLTVYTYEELETATESFSEDRRIKGSVYHATINGDAAAVKRLKGDASTEINILKQINHSNVIRLSGFCLLEGDTYLVYEFAENGSLGDWLHPPAKNRSFDSTATLDWNQRVRAARDVADGLSYLHSCSARPHIHKNLSSGNVLLDGGFRAKIGNFGLARTAEDGEAAQLTRHVVGTQGYMAPEFLEHGLITPKLDVFAFGVVLLELLSGKEAVCPAAAGEVKAYALLSGSIADVLSGENVREELKNFVDPRLGREYPFDLAFAMSELAARCVEEDPNSRPTMGEILVSLSAIHTGSLDWDPSDALRGDSMIHDP